MRTAVFSALILILTVVTSSLRVFESDQVLKLIQNSGYQGEAHQIETEDGYILKLHRIVPKVSNGRRPVILCHGILATSADFLIMGPEYSIAYLLSDHGYDVWLGNTRGSKHSTLHRLYSPDSLEYWQFSWHQMGQFDYPAAFDYILSQTNSSSLNFIGHSQGTTSLLVCLSIRPEYNKKINQAHIFAPSAFRKKLPKSLIVKNVLRYLDGHSEIRFLEIRRLLRFSERVSKTICRDNDLSIFGICRRLLRATFGGNKSVSVDLVDVQFVPEIIPYLSPRLSAMQLTHYYQNMIANKFREFDYKDKNYLYYKSATPREYDLKKVTASMYLYHAANDNLVTEEGAAYLKSLLPNVKQFRVIKDFNHIDFVYNKSARMILYDDVIRTLQ